MFAFGSQFLGPLPEEPPPRDLVALLLTGYAFGVVTGLVIAAFIVAR